MKIICTWPNGKPGTCLKPAEWTVVVHLPDQEEKLMHLCGTHARLGFKTAKAFHGNAGRKTADFVTFMEIGDDPGARDKRIMRSEKATVDERREAFRRHNRRTAPPQDR